MASLAALLVDRAKELTRHIAGAISGDVRHVHQGRVASRRLRESLPAAGRGSGKAASRARKAFREITRALGPVRELDVALAHLEDGLRDQPERGAGAPARRGAGRGAGAPAERSATRIPRVSIERVRAHVLTERERRREKMLARLERVDLDEAVSRVERVARGSETAITSFSAGRLAERIRLRAGALASAIDHAGTLYHPEKLHEVRIAAKKLRYGLEVVSSTALSDQAANIRSLKRVQELLGLMHDYQILLEHVAAVREATPKGTPGAAGLKSMAAAYDRECRTLHASYLKLAPGLAASAKALGELSLEARKRVTPARSAKPAGPARPAKAAGPAKPVKRSANG